MATEYHYWTGKVKWAKVWKQDPEYHNYTVDFFPDDPSVFKDAGLSLEPKEGDYGTFYRIKRDHERMIKGEQVVFGPPKVFINTGQLDDKGIPIVEPFSKAIGNGSVVTVKVATFPAGRFIGHRLESIRVDEHVPYEKDPNVPKEATVDFPF